MSNNNFPDNEYWKKHYCGFWEDGKRRTEKIGSLVESFGFNVTSFGFLPKSTEYSSSSPEQLGIPDLIVSTEKFDICLLEVTGTKKVIGDDIWIRPDKFEFARKNQNLPCWLGYIEESTNYVRFIKLENSDRFKTINPVIRGITETYKSIPKDSSLLLKLDDFFFILSGYVSQHNSNNINKNNAKTY